MTNNELRIGTEVSYEDMANPLRNGEITDIRTSDWGVQYEIRWEDGSISFSDCRQAGWKAA